MTRLPATPRRLGFRHILGVATALALAALLIWPHVPTNAVLGSATTLESSSQPLSANPLTLITDMPYESAEAAALLFEQRIGAMVDIVSTSGVHSGSSSLLSAADRLRTAPGTTQILVWVGWGDIWGERLGLREATVRSLETVRDRFPAANVILAGPIPAEGEDPRSYGAVDVILGRAARAVDVAYVSGLRDERSRASGDVGTSDSAGAAAEGARWAKDLIAAITPGD